MGVLQGFGPDGEYIIHGLMGINHEYVEEIEDVATYLLPVFRWAHPHSVAILQKDAIDLVMSPRQTLVDMYRIALDKFTEVATAQDHKHWNNSIKLEGEEKMTWVSYAKH